MFLVSEVDSVLTLSVWSEVIRSQVVGSKRNQNNTVDFEPLRNHCGF